MLRRFRYKLWLVFITCNLIYMSLDLIWDVPLEYYIRDYDGPRQDLQDKLGFGKKRQLNAVKLVLLIFIQHLTSSRFVRERPAHRPKTAV